MIFRGATKESPSQAKFEDEVETVEMLAKDIDLLKQVVMAIPTVPVGYLLNAESKSHNLKTLVAYS